MAIELVVPKVGESITEVQIVEWLKSEGEAVERDGNVAVIETDKATVELPAPAAGVITKVLKGKGQTAKVGEVIGYLEEGTAAAAKPNGSASSASAKPAPESAPEVSSAPSRTAKGKAESFGDGGTPSAKGSGAVMPAAQRVLAQAGLDASDVQATGPGGRLLKEDVQRHLESGASAKSAPAAPAAPSAPAASGGAAPATAFAGSAGRTEEAVPMSMLRKRVAERLVQAQQTAALLTTFNEVDMSAAMELRSRHQEAFQKRHGIKLGFMSFFVRAVVDALRLVPQLNAEIRGTDIVYRNYADISVAVSGPKGLVVPVLRGADRMGFAEIELAIADFGKRAQANAIKLEELQGGTFTISNGGVFGSLLSTPIVNPPQSGVLGMHAIQDRPVARNGQVVIRPMMYVALTYDHRIVDGREAVTFLKRIKEGVEDPARLLLEI
jgi:2-oxoglutarate dehydrogenase E2 component (dihydrolipoamide succinyltransferase)